MPAEPSLQSRLAAALPVGVNLQAYHVSTTPTSTSPLFASLPGTQDEETFCESHFLAVGSPQEEGRKEVLIYAVEILIFTSPNLTTLFVSKADSSGFSSRLNAPKGSPSIVGSVISTFVEFLLEPRLTRSRVVLSLFARSQNQYLFPGSIENEGKHVLDDRQLIKWWCRVLDNVLRLRTENTSPSCKATAHLLVPGCDRAETRAFFPPSSRLDSPSDPKWVKSYPVELLVSDISKPPRHLVPRLPDDPKSRFLEDLDGDFVDEHGQWRSVKTLDQFWEMMSYRQECSAGRLVGFIWLVFSPGQSAHTSLNLLEKTGHTNQPAEASARSKLPTPESSQLRENDNREPGVQLGPNSEGAEKMQSPPLSSPIGGSETAAEAAAPSMEDHGNGSLANPTPSTEQSASATNEGYAKETQGDIVIDAGQYQSLSDYLLASDFAGEDLAAESTRGWVQKALELSGAAAFGRPIQGECTLSLSTGAEQAPAQQVNVLTGVRKKRKLDNVLEDSPAASQDGAASGPPAINSLPAGLVRKKAKG